jgi:radical SAM protein with 4Fe4S-binding SPASM domain
MLVQYWVKYPKWHRKFRFYPGYEQVYAWYRQRFARKYAPVVGRAVDLLHALHYPLTRVEIETIDICQNDCSFCPRGVKSNPKKPTIMTDAVFRKIIDELAFMDYDGGCYLSSNGEALLDPDYPRRQKYAKESLPHAKHVLYTNGLALTPKMLHDIMPYLDSLMLDNYNDSLTLIPGIRRALEGCTQDEADKITILMRHKTDVLDTRGGQSPSRKLKPTIQCSCTNPFSELVITEDGTVPMCCQDVFNKNVMGNVWQTSIAEVWHGERFQKVRKSILANCRSEIPMCRECDFIRSTPVVDEDLKTYHAVRQEGLPK